MRRIIPFLALAALLTALLAGCGGKAPVSAPPEPEATQAQEAKIDLDLTALSSTMVYAEVYSIVGDPPSHVGEVMRLSGPYYSVRDEEAGSRYSFIIVEDALGCCQQGIEIVLNGDGEFPEEYAQVVVTGVYGSYEENGETYYCIFTDRFDPV